MPRAAGPPTGRFPFSAANQHQTDLVPRLTPRLRWNCGPQSLLRQGKKPRNRGFVVLVRGGCGDEAGPTNVGPAEQPHAIRAWLASAAGRAGGKFPARVAASGSAVPAAAGRYEAARHNYCTAPALCSARAAKTRVQGSPDSSTAPSSPADTALLPRGSQ